MIGAPFWREEVQAEMRWQASSGALLVMRCRLTDKAARRRSSGFSSAIARLIAFGYDEGQAYTIAATFLRKADERTHEHDNVEVENALIEAELRELLQEAIDEQAA